MSTSTRSHVAATLPYVFPEVFPGLAAAAPLDLPSVTARTRQQVSDLIVSPTYDAWSEALVRVGNCAQPIRLRGRSQRVDATTGEIVSTYSSEQEPLGVTHIRCGNRRASECQSCSRLYAVRGVVHFHALVRLDGPHTPDGFAPAPSAINAAQLVTAAATSVRLRVPGVDADDPSRILVFGRQFDARPVRRKPICGDCYDYCSQLVWQWWAPDLWRRFTIALHRLAAKHLKVPATRLAEVATGQYAKVAEYRPDAAQQDSYELLDKWTHMLGFRGHLRLQVTALLDHPRCTAACSST